jgi:hypothetical protein
VSSAYVITAAPDYSPNGRAAKTKPSGDHSACGFGSSRGLAIIVVWFLALPIIWLAAAVFMWSFERHLKKLTGPWILD